MCPSPAGPQPARRGAGGRSHGGRPLPRKCPSSPGEDDRFPTVALTRLRRTPRRLTLRSICTVGDAAPEASPAPLARLPRRPPCRVRGTGHTPAHVLTLPLTCGNGGRHGSKGMGSGEKTESSPDEQELLVSG